MSTASIQVSALAELIALHRALADRLARSEEVRALKALEQAIAALQAPRKPSCRKLTHEALPIFDPPAPVPAAARQPQ